jgi:hypothetical protein
MQGIMMLASSDWLAYHRQHSTGKRVVYYGSPDRETHSDTLFCVQRGTQRKIIAVGKIQKQVRIHQDKAWAEYMTALGTQTEDQWRQQASSVLHNSQNNYGGEILAIELSDFRFFPEPIDPEPLGIGNTGWQKMKRLAPEAATNLMKIFDATAEPDFALAQEFGLNPDEKNFTEGKELLRQHLAKERNQDLVNEAKEFWLKTSNGKLRCEVCGFSFLETYGQVGAGFVEAHHRVPIASLKTITVVKIIDLAPVCSNCHRMLHRHQPLHTIEELKQVMAKQKNVKP